MRTLFSLLISSLLVACNSGQDKQETVVADTVAIPATPKQQVCGNAASEAKIDQALSMEELASMTEEDVKEWRQAKEKPAQGVISFELDTTYDAHCILSVTALIESMGAYPTFWNEYVNVDKNTGNPLEPKDIFNNTQLASLTLACDNKLKKNIAKARMETEPDDLELFDERISEKGSFTNEDLDIFYLTDTTLVFEYEFSFPHVALALQPSGSIVFTKAEIKSYIDPKGRLTQWVQF